MVWELHLTRAEQKSITQLIERAINGVDGTKLQPMDIEADAIIRALFVRNPEAAYRVTMLAVGLAGELEAQGLQKAEAPARKTWLCRLFKPLSATIPAPRQITAPDIHPSA